MKRRRRQVWAGRGRRGAAAVEYVLILALVVLPLALLLPTFVKMVTAYAARMLTIVKLPFP